MANFIVGIISISISLVIFAGIFMTTVQNTNTTGTPVITGANPVCTSGALVNCTLPYAWTTTEVVLWGTLSVVGIAGMVYGVLNIFGLA